MPLIISPKTTREVIKAFNKKLNLHKIPRKKSQFWHGNFQDSFYSGLNGKTKVLFTGYSGPVAGYSLIEYATHYLKDDKKPEVYFIGSTYAFRASNLEPGDLAYAINTYSPDSFEQSIYKNAKGRGIENYTCPNRDLLGKALEIADEKNIELKPCKVYCSITPGYLPDFKNPMRLMTQGMWWKLSLADEIGEKGCNCGEYESAAVLACSKLFGIPAVALFDVKDKSYSESKYKIAPLEKQIIALDSILDIVKESIIR